ncbi:hypothetical protein WUBG_18427 [Wuchereria bancrofti]|uniref:Uncharacterized protein n=1 Tax=Wuchereria bancrofti TaxID=6293 RepID=J9DM22_WUCBA|nr:hypothetical protein WUBG_18427 [Wuchereria bancrofti]
MTFLCTSFGIAGTACLAFMVQPAWPSWYSLLGLHGTACLAFMVQPAWPSWYSLLGLHA